MKKTELKQEEQVVQHPTSKKAQLEELSQRQIELEQDLERDKYRVQEIKGHIQTLKAHARNLNILCKQLVIMSTAAQNTWNQKYFLDKATCAKGFEHELINYAAPLYMTEELKEATKRLANTRQTLRETHYQIVALMEQNAETQQKSETSKEAQTGYNYPGDKKGGEK